VGAEAVREAEGAEAVTEGEAEAVAQRPAR